MGRPKKNGPGSTPTKERILETAMELFAQRGYDAVSVRDITKSLGLNEASLYNHFKNKEDLLAAIFRRMDERLIHPGFIVPPPEVFKGSEPFDLSEFLIEGARRFFQKAGRETLLTWRILMTSQYQREAARDSVRGHLLEAPRRFFAGILESLKSAGRIRPDADVRSAGRIIAAVFFDYSFSSNLGIAWNDEDSESSGLLEADIRFIAESLKPSR
jgi:AcrR family transcriptional regulator